MEFEGDLNKLLDVIKTAHERSPFNFGDNLKAVNVGIFKVTIQSFKQLERELNKAIDRVNDDYAKGSLFETMGYFAYTLDTLEVDDGFYLIRVGCVENSDLESVIDLKFKIQLDIDGGYRYPELISKLQSLGVDDYIDNTLSDLEYNVAEVPKEKVDAVCYGLADRLTSVSTFNNSDGWLYYLMSVEEHKTVVNITVLKGSGVTMAEKKWLIKLKVTNN